MLHLASQYEGLCDLALCCDSDKNRFFFSHSKTNKRREPLLRLVVHPVLIISVHAFKHQQLLKMTSYVSLRHAERVIIFHHLVQLDLLLRVHVCPHCVS